MLQDVELEVLLFSSRHTLDAYQVVSVKSNQIIQRNNDKLARRRINLLQMNECYDASPFSVSNVFDAFMHDSFVHTRTYEETAMRMRNSFISEIRVYCMRCAGFLPWLHANPDVWSDCRADELQLGSIFGHCRHQHAIPHDELLPICNDLNVSKLCLPLRRPEDLLKAQRLVSQSMLKSLRLDLSPRLVQAAADFVDFLFDINLAERVDINLLPSGNLNPIAYQFVTAYVQRFIGADVFARIVPLVTIRMEGDIPPARPVVCDRPVRTSMKASAFFDDLDDSSCKLYEFKNLARKEVLQVYRGSARSQKAHFSVSKP